VRRITTAGKNAAPGMTTGQSGRVGGLLTCADFDLWV